MDAVKEDLHGTLDIITLEFLSSWDLNSMMQDTVAPKVPVGLVLQRILRCAAQTDRAREKRQSRIGIMIHNVESVTSHCLSLQLSRYLDRSKSRELLDSRAKIGVERWLLLSRRTQSS